MTSFVVLAIGRGDVTGDNLKAILGRAFNSKLGSFVVHLN